MKSGIYRIDINNKVYIGSSENIERRWKEHKKCLKVKKHPNTKLQRMYDKYGEEKFKFTVVEYCDPEKLLYYEQIWLDILFSSLENDEILNICKVAESPMKGLKHSDIAKSKISNAVKGDNNPMFGKGEDRIGNKNTFFGKHHTSENRKIISNVQKNRFSNYDERKEASKRKGYNPVYLIHESGIIEFVDIQHDFVNRYSLDEGHVSRLINGKRKSHKGWRLYKGDV